MHYYGLTRGTSEADHDVSLYLQSICDVALRYRQGSEADLAPPASDARDILEANIRVFFLDAES